MSKRIWWIWTHIIWLPNKPVHLECHIKSYKQHLWHKHYTISSKYNNPKHKTLKDKKLEEREKEEITTLISQTLSELHSRLYKGDKILTQNSQEEAIKIVNRSIREVINHNNKTKIVKITNSNFPNKTKTLKEFFNESQYNVSGNWINKEIATNDYYEIHSHDEGKISKTKLGGNQI